MMKNNSVAHKIERKTVETMVDSILKKMNKDREGEFLHLVDYVEKFYKGNYDFDKVRAMIKDPNNRWMKFVNKVLDETNPHVAKMTIMNLGYEAFLEEQKKLERIEKFITVIFLG